jgi:hypothetical protein
MVSVAARTSSEYGFDLGKWNASAQWLDEGRDGQRGTAFAIGHFGQHWPPTNHPSLDALLPFGSSAYQCVQGGE